MKLVYFAWVREKIGKPEDEIDIPNNVNTVGDLLQYLKTLDETYQRALEPSDVIRVAIDHEHVDDNSPIKGAKEIAIFPPMTGG